MRAVLFDVDGVLLDSLAVQVRVWGRWCRERSLDEAVVGHSTFGRRPAEAVRELAPHHDAATEVAALNAMLYSEGDLFPPMVGARELLSVLPPRSWALVTSGSRQDTVRRFEAVGLVVPAVVVAGEDAAAGKPDPTCYRLAAQQLGSEPGECLVVEDVPAGVEAALGAGMRVLAVASTRPREDLGRADVVAGDLVEASAQVGEWLQGRRSAGS